MTFATKPRTSANAADEDQPAKRAAADSRKDELPSDEKSKSATADKDAKTEDDLPEREPLTPELVEDEAIRGDFMLRWALILLAFLLGCTEIFETATLVHVKSGQYTLQNYWPATTDVFSSSVQGRPWINLGWLFDLLLAVVYNLGELVGAGGIALSVFKAAIAAAAFGVVVHTTHKEVPTWWGTICGGIALLACYRQFTARPEIVTLLGLALTVNWLHRWKEAGNSKSIVHLAILFALWGNLDPRMFLGLAVIAFYAIGETLGDWLGFPGLPDEQRRKKLWLALGVCAAATLINPFLWNALLSPVSLYESEYAAHQIYNNTMRGYEQIQFRGLLDRDIWSRELLTLSVGAGLLTLATAVVTFGLNFRRLDLGHVFVLLAFAAFSVLAVHELAAAAVVAAGLAALNAQDWYRNTFRQTYSVETSELIFSRGGRAVTVLAMFGIAYLAISGVDLLDMRLSRRTGVGIHPDVSSAIEGLRDELNDSYDDRPFNFVLSQGDLLIWLDQRPFIDSRLKLYASDGQPDIAQLHDKTRQSIVAHALDGTKPDDWKQTLNEYHVTHVLLRLDSRLTLSSAAYQFFFRLRFSPAWRLSTVGPTAAVFYRTDLVDDPNAGDWAEPKKYAAYLDAHRFTFPKYAFRTSWDVPDTRPTWPKAASMYDKYLSRPKSRTPNAVEEAAHYYELLHLNLQVGGVWTEARMGEALALAHLAIRRANEGLNDEAVPHHAKAYLVLGRSYFALRVLESLAVNLVAQREGRILTEPMRQAMAQLSGQIAMRRGRQAIAALAQCVVREPDHLIALRAIARVHAEVQNIDLAIEALDSALEIASRRGLPDEGPARQDFDADANLRKELQARVEGDLKQIEQGRARISTGEADREKRVQIASYATSRGLVNLAIEIIEEDPGCVDKQPQGILLWIDLLQRAGRAEEAYNEIQRLQLEQAQLPPQGRVWQRNLIAFAELGRGNYLKPETLWRQDAELAEGQRLQQIFDTLPMSMNSATTAATELNAIGSQQRGGGLWFFYQTTTLRQMTDANSSVLAQVTGLYLNAALTNLEAGRHSEARKQFERIREIAPASPASQLSLIYLAQMTGQPLAKLAPPPKKKPAKKPAKKRPGKSDPLKAKP